MAASDRTQLKQVVTGELGSSRTVTNAQLTVAQDAQRFVVVGIGTAALAANTNANVSMLRCDRPCQVKEVRILPGAALTQDTGNLVVSYGFTNDNGGAMTTMGQINTNTAANGGTGNWAAQTSIVVTANAAINAIVPSGSFFFVKLVTTAPSQAVPAGTAFQLLMEEV